MEREKEVQGKYKVDFSWLIYIPIALILGIVPLIVRFSVVPIKEEAYIEIINQTDVVDLFSQYKAGAIMVLTGIMLIILFLVMSKKHIKIDNWMKVYGISALIYSVFTIISALNSDYKAFAWWGIPDRAEGAVILVCYVIITFYTIYAIRKTADYKYILAPLMFVVCVVAFIGYFQYIGQDIFIEQEWANKLIIPEQYSKYRNGLKGLYEKGKVYGTMYHYNYIGSFAAMIVPLFMTLTLFIRDYKKKILFAITTILGGLVLLGSTSRAGLIGLGLSSIFFVILCARQLFQKWKLLVPLSVGVMIIIMVLNSLTNGEIFNRIPSLINDATALFMPSDKTYDYKENLPIKGIINTENKVIVKTNQGEINIQVGDTQKEGVWGLEFEDENGQRINSKFQGETYVLEDPRFAGINIDKRSNTEEGLNKWLIQYNKEKIFYFVAGKDEISYINPITEVKEQWEEPERIGFYGKEKLGSARGYIWSRSIPLLKESLFIGYGPDAYGIVFPQDDYLGKWDAYGTTNMIVDKPHNLYLQIGIGQGVIALLAFLGLVGTYIVQSMKLYMNKRQYDTLSTIGIGLMLSIVGYLGAGIFNDSVVSVAPIFWVLLGVGIATNFMVNKEKKEIEKRLQHATISIKTKKHI